MIIQCCQLPWFISLSTREVRSSDIYPPCDFCHITLCPLVPSKLERTMRFHLLFQPCGIPLYIQTTDVSIHLLLCLWVAPTISGLYHLPTTRKDSLYFQMLLLPNSPTCSSSPWQQSASLPEENGHMVVLWPYYFREIAYKAFIHSYAICHSHPNNIALLCTGHPLLWAPIYPSISQQVKCNIFTKSLKYSLSIFSFLCWTYWLIRILESKWKYLTFAEGGFIHVIYILSW